MIGRRGAKLEDLEALYRSRFEVFARVAASVTGDADRGHDAVQEAFATAVRKRRSFRGDGSLEAWVWRIVLNAARSDVRRSAASVDSTGGHRLRRRGEAPVWARLVPDGRRIAFEERAATTPARVRVSARI